ncbi:dTDP-4-dehydrorhamnose 3,5-epimerase family protein [Terasakiella sp. A23]|uniref:dTDP-4-dehydrorhamnose 3,5-epimerase family protein n=1 Tax=Terasakiella sp. FCG-A23 TaxID=3080561 RepID=UPI00295335FE|nr:dTDP-4-dehydrorhamnose 3,5-epimerase family protein [Terasakiella sp. A23]MDV7339033.1 dTDP-4-dehydrorhamnose 3,5-epimerase family protein [Terasakiella sp. A23]
MKVDKTKLDGVLKITPPTIFEDFRGEYIETYNERIYHEAGITQKFIQDDISLSSRHVLRGIHGDQETWKLISCLHGKFYIVVINNDPESDQYRQWEGHTLSAKNRQQLLIPPKFGNGHVILSEEAIFHYKQTSEYNRAGQFTLIWNDPELDIFWPIENPILSLRDKFDK